MGTSRTVGLNPPQAVLATARGYFSETDIQAAPSNSRKSGHDRQARLFADFRELGLIIVNARGGERWSMKNPARRMNASGNAEA
jgi:hypothetical protein